MAKKKDKQAINRRKKERKKEDNIKTKEVATTTESGITANTDTCDEGYMQNYLDELNPGRKVEWPENKCWKCHYVCVDKCVLETEDKEINDSNENTEQNSPEVYQNNATSNKKPFCVNCTPGTDCNNCAHQGSISGTFHGKLFEENWNNCKKRAVTYGNYLKSNLYDIDGNLNNLLLSRYVEEKNFLKSLVPKQFHHIL